MLQLWESSFNDERLFNLPPFSTFDLPMILVFCNPFSLQSQCNGFITDDPKIQSQIVLKVILNIKTITDQSKSMLIQDFHYQVQVQVDTSMLVSLVIVSTTARQCQSMHAQGGNFLARILIKAQHHLVKIK